MESGGTTNLNEAPGAVGILFNGVAAFRYSTQGGNLPVAKAVLYLLIN